MPRTSFDAVPMRRPCSGAARRPLPAVRAGEAPCSVHRPPGRGREGAREGEGGRRGLRAVRGVLRCREVAWLTHRTLAAWRSWLAAEKADVVLLGSLPVPGPCRRSATSRN